MDIEEFVQRLQGVKGKGQDKYMACCPAHEDRDPSLSVTVSSSGKILVHCWAGCSALDVVQAMGLQLSDLFERPLDYERPMAFAQREMAERRKREEILDHERMVLALGYSDRKAGKRLSSQDMAAERRAFEILREAGVEASPEVCYYAMQERLR